MSASVLTFSNLLVAGWRQWDRRQRWRRPRHQSRQRHHRDQRRRTTGIFAQSVGGGGGTAGIGASLLSVNFSTGVTGPRILGGTGGVGGNGGLVTVVNEGGIVINGDDSVNTPVFSLPGFSFTLGGSAGANGNGGDINVTNTGSIAIIGDDADRLRKIRSATTTS